MRIDESGFCCDPFPLCLYQIHDLVDHIDHCHQSSLDIQKWSFLTRFKNPNLTLTRLFRAYYYHYLYHQLPIEKIIQCAKQKMNVQRSNYHSLILLFPSLLPFFSLHFLLQLHSYPDISIDLLAGQHHHDWLRHDATLILKDEATFLTFPSIQSFSQGCFCTPEPECRVSYPFCCWNLPKSASVSASIGQQGKNQGIKEASY